MASLSPFWDFFDLAINQIAKTGLSSLQVIYYFESLFINYIKAVLFFEESDMAITDSWLRSTNGKPQEKVITKSDRDGLFNHLTSCQIVS
ncbi:hypothetical protein [Xenorhabdus bovienii]|nr:hypothetical protein [Xenorhabdus bovienii]